MKKILLIIMCFFSITIIASDKIQTLPDAPKLKDTQFAGYLNAGDKNKLFYWFVSNKNINAPIVLWSNGGPGYSSMYGFFNETGPYFVNGNETLKVNRHGWDRFSNYLVIDHPANVGMSYLPNNHVFKTPDENIHTYYLALKNFFKKHPEYKNNPVYLAGESYAGTYIPLLAQEILTKNKNANQKIHLKGLILISPWADPIRQISADSEYALTHGLIDRNEKYSIDKKAELCFHDIKTKQYVLADSACDNVTGAIQKDSGLWLANIDNQSISDNKLMDAYLNRPDVRKAIHATQTFPYHAWSDQVNKIYLGYIDRPIDHVYNFLLAQKIPLMIISGLSDDKDTNFLGVNNFIAHLKWSSKKEFLTLSTHEVKINNQLLGYEKNGGLISQALIYHAGHMVPQDQPQIDKIVKKFIHETQ